ncbi:MAG: 2-oxoacid:acceptor oxidoreductase family protein [Anaerolineae bacterium]|uniref:2-oxoacid:acceptor oxidoreductase family protein n=1 Tax=Thermoflexus sp. TaxID=1969742 RepID=UPI0025CCED14|nr:2-oxoacid:acceptor oxidoreductase family protein [Thermoflexus sp.]MCS7352303.1 2-oxoacid:acceptor oxidoreductase family protein [Thermoflexus sp.]MDW8181766.1 2-oxoacid:acceptor oxidoreductase family protein [Anaerolineae bacterium]
MQVEIVIAGFGGQGILFAGQVLAHAAMEAGKNVTWFPSYGPEMRGGTANCTVIISDEEIGSPLVRHPRAAIVMNRPSLDKYEPLVQPGGLLVVNASMAGRSVERTDVEVVALPASEIAEALGDRRLANMVMVGALLARLPVLSLEQVEGALQERMPVRHRHLMERNILALREGARAAQIAFVPAVSR